MKGLIDLQQAAKILGCAPVVARKRLYPADKKDGKRHLYDPKRVRKVAKDYAPRQKDLCSSVNWVKADVYCDKCGKLFRSTHGKTTCKWCLAGKPRPDDPHDVMVKGKLARRRCPRCGGPTYIGENLCGLCSGKKRPLKVSIWDNLQAVYGGRA
jgi:hypothetical protein